MMIIKYDNNNKIRADARPARAPARVIAHAHAARSPCTPAAARRPAPHHAAPRAARPRHTTVLESSMRTAYHTGALVSLGVTFTAVKSGFIALRAQARPSA